MTVDCFEEAFAKVEKAAGGVLIPRLASRSNQSRLHVRTPQQRIMIIIKITITITYSSRPVVINLIRIQCE